MSTPPANWGTPLWGTDLYGGSDTTQSNITIIVQDVLGNPQNGTIRIEPVLGSVSGGLVYVPDVITATLIGGTVTILVPSGVLARYWFQQSGSLIKYFLGALAPSGDGNFGQEIRSSAGLVVGSTAFRTISGFMTAAQAPPSLQPQLSLSQSGIGKDGTVYVPVPIGFPVNQGTGLYTVVVPQTQDMYTPAGGSAFLRLLYSGSRVGGADINIPAIDGMAFIALNGNVLVGLV